jgi:hypothetical protein
VILGEGTPTVPLTLPFDQPYWLEVQVGGVALAPRVKLTSSPYSLNALSVTDGAVTTSKLADNAVTSGKIQPNVVSGVEGVSNDGGNIDLVPGSNITIAGNDAANTITIGANDVWKLNGNGGTDPIRDFLGTTDNKALELRVNNVRALRLEPDPYCPNIICGVSSNNVTPGVHGATISGGGSGSYANSVTKEYGTVGGGEYNIASGIYATISGGINNKASEMYDTVGGGNFNTTSGSQATVSGGGNNVASGASANVSGGGGNTASGQVATIGGGGSNKADGDYSTIGGGHDNTASGSYATVPGGYNNIALGAYGFAAGRKSRVYHQGAFMFADSNNFIFASQNNNEMAMRCTGGARIVTGINGATGAITAGVQVSAGGGSWSSISDRNLKENFIQMDGHEVLNRLASIPVESWNYKSQNPAIRHIGPMAQDFYAAFGLGEDDKHITTVDADGVALAAIQGLYELVKEKEAELAIQKEQNAELRQRIDDLEARLKVLEASLTQ